jgi:hypothetical protein
MGKAHQGSKNLNGMSMHQSKKPNIVLVLADNLGWGELGCYGGGALRGAPTPRIDEIAQSGMKFLNFNVESDCVPTRSALMTGRHPIRTGAVQSVPAGLPQGIHPWERTLPQILKEAGYATGISAVSTSGTVFRAPPMRPCSPVHQDSTRPSLTCPMSWRVLQVSQHKM